MAAYTTFLQNVSLLRNHDCDIPPSLTTELTPAYLWQHRAVWHKDCHSKYNRQKVERALKRAPSEMEHDKDSRKLLKRKKTDKEKCLFYDEGEDSEILRNCSTFNIDCKLKRIAREMGNKEIETKLSGGSDVIALETKYHLKCYNKFLNDYRGFQRKTDSAGKEDEKRLRSRVFEELISGYNF